MWLQLSGRQPYLKTLPRAPMSSSLFLCSSQVRHASLPAPLRRPGRYAARLPPAAASLVSPSLHRSLPLHWTGSVVRMISSCFVLKRRRRRNGVYASLFGVGAPEALVIGVVALLVFGPKGLAEVARNLGKTLRAFQPTIRELQDVSRDFRSTLEREIGLDEDPPSTSYRPPPTNSTHQPVADPPTNTSQQPAADPPTNTSQQPVADPVLDAMPETTVPYTSDELMKVTQQQLAASAIAAWNAKQASSSEQQEAAAAATTPSQSSEAAAETTPSQSSETAAAITPSQSSEAALSGGSDGPGAVTEESNSSNTENAKPRDEA